MVSIVAIIGKNGAIGRKNRLLWNVPEDMNHFRKITSGHDIIMGEKTFQSIGKPLPNRRNIVVTLDRNFSAEGVEIRNSLENVLNEYKNSKKEAFVIGGGIIYALSLPFADKLYLTLVNDSPVDADTFFPDYSEFKNIIKEEFIDNGEYGFTFLELTK